MDLDHASEAHAQWKVKFRMAIDSKEALDAATIGKDNCCELGKWLHGDGSVTLGAKPEFTALVEKHKAFHIEAGKVATAINNSKYDEAANMIVGGTPFSHTSFEVIAALHSLKKVIAASAAG